jgi:hypothetical protein
MSSIGNGALHVNYRGNFQMKMGLSTTPISAMLTGFTFQERNGQ